MKKVFSILGMVLCTLAISAQKDVTTFLGIPVDGFKEDMREKLISKGFIPKTDEGGEYFVGEFNGTDVNVYIGVNNNKVYRISLINTYPLDEANIKIEFNKLVSQFENNKRYISVDKYTIPEDEDISYNMNNNNKNYTTLYFQKPVDFTLEDPLLLTGENRIKYAKELELASKKIVSFGITEKFGRYSICIFYVNAQNLPNGEDL